MNTAMSQQELADLMDQAVRKVTEQTAGIQLSPSGETLGENLCTVHITFSRGFHTSLTLCADTGLLVRMARNALGEEELSQQDVEDFCKEYFNILCGKIAAILFRTTNVPARFSVPVFYRGRYTPENHQTQFMLTYADAQKESAQLTHHVPYQRADQKFV